MSTSFKNRFYSAPPTSQNVQMGYAYGAQSVVTGANLNVTGNWVPMNTDAQGNLNVAVAGGLTFTGTVAVPANTFITGNPFVQILGPVSAINGGFIGITGAPRVSVTNDLNVTGANITGTVVANWPASTIASNNIPSGANGLALSANNARRSWFVQNNSTGAGPLFLGLGSAASAQAYHMILKPASSLNAADGGIFLDDGARWRGGVFVSGQNPNYIIWELT